MEIEELFNFILNKDYGTLITHKEISNIIGTTTEYTRYRYIMKTIKNMLIPYSKILKAIPNVGYQILKNEQVSGYVYRTYINRSGRLFEKSTEILESLNTENFNNDRKNEYNDIVELNEQIKKLSKKCITQSKYYDRMAYYNSLEEN